MGIVEEEADASAFWIEWLVESGHVQPEASSSLMREANELTAIAVSSASTARKHQKR